MKNNMFSVLTSSCDKYSDLWDIHVQLLEKNWNNREYDTYIVTDKNSEKEYANVRMVSVGEGVEVPRRLKAVAELVKPKYILVTLYDYF